VKIFGKTLEEATYRPAVNQTEQYAQFASTYKSAAGGRVKFKSGLAVEPDSDLVDEGHVLCETDTQPPEPYSCVLNLVEVNAGKNSYYKLQIIQHNEGNT
jgi:hypothetical protein